MPRALLEDKETHKSLKGHLEKAKEFFKSYPLVMSHFIEETTRETGYGKMP
jgi:hypothetical protein